MADVSASESRGPSPLRSSRGLWLSLAGVFVVLFAAYWFFIRATYEPVLTNVAPEDGADIVKVLEDHKLPYRFADGGRTILVPSDEVDRARIELVGSELPMRGQVGFELFNQSDMGLTEFAQKINYQRALQGELARTILLLEGIQSVRVHLGLPERSVFRDERAQPKASVTLILKPGKALTEGTVSGIQRMVAGAIPEMGVDEVSVLDGSGRVVSTDSFAQVPLTGSDALLGSYRQQISAAISRTHPELRYDLNLSLRHVVPQVLPSGSPAGETEAAPRGNPDFAVNVRVTTSRPVDDSMRLELMRKIHQIIDFDGGRGDAILFLVGDVAATSTPVQTAAVPDRIVTKAATPAPVDSDNVWSDYWPLLGIGIVALLAAAWLSDRYRRSRQRKPEELARFADQLRERLRFAEGAAS